MQGSLVYSKTIKLPDSTHRLSYSRTARPASDKVVGCVHNAMGENRARQLPPSGRTVEDLREAASAHVVPKLKCSAIAELLHRAI